MAKYVCDFEEVTNLSTYLMARAEEIENLLTTYENEITEQLSGWEGDAKVNFLSSNTNQVNVAKNHVQTMKSLADHFQKVVEEIIYLEEDLATLKL